MKLISIEIKEYDTFFNDDIGSYKWPFPYSNQSTAVSGDGGNYNIEMKLEKYR